MFSRIQNPPIIRGKVPEESVAISLDELESIETVAISARDLLGGGLSSIAAGTLTNLAVSGTGGLISTFSVASTGTAISSLSGAAATNATLAALGGGSLATGGAGMAGGAAVLGGLTIAPMVMVGGIMLNSKGKQALETAKDIRYEADEAVQKMQESEVQLNKIDELAQSIQNEMQKMNEIYLILLEKMENVVYHKTDYHQFTQSEKRTLEKTYLAVTALKKLTMQNILDSEEENPILESEVRSCLREAEFQRMFDFCVA